MLELRCKIQQHMQRSFTMHTEYLPHYFVYKHVLSLAGFLLNYSTLLFIFTLYLL